MHKNFPYWASMQFESKKDEWTNQTVRHIRYLFNNDIKDGERYISETHFRPDSGDELLKRCVIIMFRIKKIRDMVIKKDKYLLTYIKHIRHNVVYKPELRSIATMVHYIEAILHYNTFMGNKSSKLDKFYGKMTLKSKLSTHSESINGLLYSGDILNEYNKTIVGIRDMQLYIHERIYNYFMFGNLAETTDSLFSFGYSFLIPLIDMMIGILDIPLSISLIKNMIYIDKKIPENIFSIVGDDISTLLNVTKNDLKKKCYLFRSVSEKDIQYELVYVVNDNNTTKTLSKNTMYKLSKCVIDIRTSFYLFFYMTYCKTISITNPNEKQRWVFTTKTGTRVDNITKSVMVLLKSNKLLHKNFEYFFSVEVNQYKYMIKRMWLAGRIEKRNENKYMDIVGFANDCETIHYGMGKDNKYNSTIKKLHDMAHASEILHEIYDLKKSSYTSRLNTLHDIPSNVYRIMLPLWNIKVFLNDFVICETNKTYQFFKQLPVNYTQFNNKCFSVTLFDYQHKKQNKRTKKGKVIKQKEGTKKGKVINNVQKNLFRKLARSLKKLVKEQHYNIVFDNNITLSEKEFDNNITLSENQLQREKQLRFYKKLNDIIIDNNSSVILYMISMIEEKNLLFDRLIIPLLV